MLSAPRKNPGLTPAIAKELLARLYAGRDLGVEIPGGFLPVDLFSDLSDTRPGPAELFH